MTTSRQGLLSQTLGVDLTLFGAVLCAGIPSLLMPCQSKETDMRKRISEIKARGAEIVGHGAVLKVLLTSLGLLVAAFIIVAMFA